MTTFVETLRSALGDRVETHVPLAPYTTFKLGGPADVMVTADTAETLRQAVVMAASCGVPVTILGGGSNLLIADAGVRGLVIRVRGGEVRAHAPGLIRAGAGVTINGLVRWTIAHGVAGLEAWAGTPGTVGGAIYGNAHFQGRNIGDLVGSVRLLARDGTIAEAPAAAMAFAYDYSRLHRTGEIVLSADFHAATGDPERLRGVARESLAYRKRTQPLAMPSAGCIFQNPVPGQDVLPPGMPWSAGALIDRAGLKGAQEGQALVSPTHGNFIVNQGHASADEVRGLIDRCKRAVFERYGVRMREEIVRVGFERETAAPGGAADRAATEE